jgi:hypothetical protein
MEASQYRIVRIRDRFGKDHFLGFLTEQQELQKRSAQREDRSLLKGIEIARQHLLEVANSPLTGMKAA